MQQQTIDETLIDTHKTPNVSTIVSEVVTPSVYDMGSFANFFVKRDVGGERMVDFSFSLLKHYDCRARCKICYLNGKWFTEDPRDPRVYPDHIPNELIDKYQVLFDLDTTIESVDDIYTFKKNQPALYEFYKEYSHYMTCSSTTDTAIIRNVPLALKDMNFRSFQEVSVSDEFLDKSGPAVMKLLDQIIEKLYLHKIKLIITSEEGYNSKGVRTLREWTERNNINLNLHHDIKFVNTVEFVRNRENEVTSLVESNYTSLNDGSLVGVLSEAVYVQYDKIYSSLLGSMGGIKVQDPWYFDLLNDKFSDYIFLNVKDKIRTYQNYLDRMSSITSTNKQARTPEQYFKWVVDHVTVNNDYNCIPYFAAPRAANFSKLFDSDFAYVENIGWLRKSYKFGDPIKFVFDIKES